MSALSLLLRILSICAAVVVVVIYVLGGNKLKDLESELADQITSNQQLSNQLEQQKDQTQKIREQLDTTVLELANMKRDKRLNDSEVLLVKQELEKTRQQLQAAESAKLAMADENQSLRRETIELKAQGFDTNNNPQILTAQIEEHRARIRKLEDELNDSQTVIRSLFGTQSPSASAHGTPIGNNTAKSTQIQRVVPEHDMLVLDVGSRHGIRENAQLHLLNRGTRVATVKVARVTPDLCVVNILTSADSDGKVLQTGAQIEYMPLST